MADEMPSYRRLTGRGMGIAVYAKLYQGPDHFLQVSSTGFTETYKRFYFRDIQAIILERRPWRLWWSCLFVAVFLLFLLPAVVSSGVEAAVYWTFATACAGALTLNLALGPCCACYVRTAVQTEQLRTLTRLRAARAFVRRAAELVKLHQPEAVTVSATQDTGNPPVQTIPPASEVAS